MNLDDAHADFVGKVRDNTYYKIKPDDEKPWRKLEEGEATQQQMLDVLTEVLGRPISSWMIFKAGWDYAMQEFRKVPEVNQDG